MNVSTFIEIGTKEKHTYVLEIIQFFKDFNMNYLNAENGVRTLRNIETGHSVDLSEKI